MECNGVADAPEDGPASKADLQIPAEVEICLLAVVPGTLRVIVSRQLSQHDVEAISPERGDERERMRARGYKAEIVGWLRVAGEGQRPHRCRPPVDCLLAQREGVPREGDSAVQLHCAYMLERCFRRYGPYYGIRIWLRSIDNVEELVDGRGLGRIAGTVLELLPVEEEQPSAV